MNIILFIIVLSALVFVHELGHFLFAKLTNTKVHSFAIGFEPTLFQKKVGETTYKLNAIPFGGYVRIHGQNGAEEGEPGDQHRSFAKKPVWAKIGMLIGGILFNVIFAWLLLSTAFGLGTQTLATDANRAELEDISHQVLSLQPNGAAETAGIRLGDTIQAVQVAGETYVNPVTEDLRTLVADMPEETFMFSVASPDMGARVVAIEPADTLGSSTPLLGLAIEEVGIQKLGFFAALGEGWTETRALSRATLQAFGGLITDTVRGQADVSSLTGPVGMVGMVGNAASVGFAYLLFFTALISINLAVLNLIPFPALDGGRILFVLIEFLTGKKIPAKVDNMINLIGFGLLILLMISVTVFDVVRLF